MATANKKRPVKAKRASKRNGIDPNMGELLELLGFNLALTHAMFIRDANAACGDLGLSAKQYTVLSIIADNHGISQVDIANALMTDRATMMAIVDRLEFRGLISRERSKIDRRRQHLILTPKGGDALGRARRAIRRSEQQLMGELAPRDVTRLLSLLKQLRGAA